MSVSKDVYLKVGRLDPLEFALVCVTTGGPATHVTWRRNGIPVGIGVKLVTSYEEATYTNEIAISGYTIAGRYDFQSSNAITNQVTSALDISGINTIIINFTCTIVYSPCLYIYRCQATATQWKHRVQQQCCWF